jgi:hypothetical protein
MWVVSFSACDQIASKSSQKGYNASLEAQKALSHLLEPFYPRGCECR